MEMKRHAVLLGNTNGLPGIHRDLEEFELLLRSDIGGAWEDNEICKVYNADLGWLRGYLHTIREEFFDYLIFYYSGHGALERRNNTVLELNNNHEIITESELINLADKQLNIFDCCRVATKPEETVNSILESYNFSENPIRSWIRSIYNRRIMEAKEQFICLYACSEGECANATESGSIYTQQLIKATNILSNSSDVLVKAAHDKAYFNVYIKSIVMGIPQRPDICIVPNVKKNEQLIIALKNN